MWIAKQLTIAALWLFGIRGPCAGNGGKWCAEDKKSPNQHNNAKHQVGRDDPHRFMLKIGVVGSRELEPGNVGSLEFNA